MTTPANPIGAGPDPRGERPTITRTFIPEDVAGIFDADFLDEDICREWILGEIYQDDEIACPRCRKPIKEMALQRFWEGRRICCRECGKFFSALTGTFLSGVHAKFREIILMAILLHFNVKPAEIARMIHVHPETIRLWILRFDAHRKIKMESILNA